MVFILRHGVRVQGELEDLVADFSDQEEIDFEQFMSSITNQQNIWKFWDMFLFLKSAGMLWVMEWVRAENKNIYYKSEIVKVKWSNGLLVKKYFGHPKNTLGIFECYNSLCFKFYQKDK